MRMQANKQRGHTLLELLTAMFVMAILVAAALPFYGQYTIKGKIRGMHDTILLAANAEDRFFSTNKRYGSTPEIADAGYLLDIANNGPLAIDAETEGKSILNLFPAYTTSNGWSYAVTLAYDVTNEGSSRLAECWAYFSPHHPSGYGGQMVHLYDDVTNHVVTPAGYSGCASCPQVATVCTLPSGG